MYLVSNSLMQKKEFQQCTGRYQTNQHIKKAPNNTSQFQEKTGFTFQPTHCLVSNLSRNQIIQVKLHICLFNMQTRNVIKRDGNHFTDCRIHMG